MAEVLDSYLGDVDSKPQTVGLTLPKLKRLNSRILYHIYEKQQNLPNK